MAKRGGLSHNIKPWDNGTSRKKGCDMKKKPASPHATGFENVEHIFNEIKSGLMDLLPDEAVPAKPASSKTEETAARDSVH